MVEFLDNAEYASDEENGKLALNERREAHDKLARKRKRMQNVLEEAKFSFRGKYADLDGLKREISRRSRSLGILSEVAPIETELTRRLDALEKKIDRIIDSLPIK